jgi:hypothetical protein
MTSCPCALEAHNARGDYLGTFFTQRAACRAIEATPRGDVRLDSAAGRRVAGYVSINHLEGMTVLPCGTGEADRRSCS